MMTTEIIIEDIGCEELLVTAWIHGGGIAKFCWVPGGNLRLFGKTEVLCKVDDKYALSQYMRQRYKSSIKIKPPSLEGEVTPLQEEITDVRMGPIEDGIETFTFRLRGVPHKARQVGRLRDLCIGHSKAADHRIAVLAIVDGSVSKVEMAA